MKTILVLGGNGRTGKLVVKYALEKGFKVKALVRDISKMDLHTDNLEVVEGSPYILEDMQVAMQGCDLVISALNNTRKTELPWSTPEGPYNILERSMENAVKLMKELDIKRIIYQSTIGASESFEFLPIYFKTLMKYTNLKIVVDDHTNAERVLRKSELEYTLVRPSGLTNGTKPNPVGISAKGMPGTTIRRIAVAKFMVESIDQTKYYQKALMLGDK